MYPIRHGFHTGPGGNPTGIGECVRALDAAGIPATIVAADVTTGLSDVFGCWEKGSPVQHRVAYRVVRGTDQFYAVPNYDLPALEAAPDYISRILPHIPPEVAAWKDRVKIIIFNEVDKNRAEWLGYCALECARILNGMGYQVLAFGWSAGEPEPEHWTLPGMRDYLLYCANNPQMAGIALHEYSLHPTDLLNGAGWLVGRYMHLYDACDELKIPYPDVWVTEFGYTHTTVVSPDNHWQQLVRLYEEFPDYPHLAEWYLGQGYSGIANLAQKHIKPAISWHTNSKIAGPLTPVGVWPDNPPAGGGPAHPGRARVRFKRKVYRFHSKTYEMLQDGRLKFEDFWALFQRILEERSEFSIANDPAAIGVDPDGEPLDRIVIEVGGEFNATEIERWYWDNYGIPAENIFHIPFPSTAPEFSGYVMPIRPLHPTDWSTSDFWDGGWFDANPFLTHYMLTSTGRWAYHTGADLNNNRPKWDADRGAELYAIADGVIIFADWLNVWGNVMILEIDDPERGTIHVRYGHVDRMDFAAGDVVQKGQIIATVGQDAAGGPYHLHFDISLSGVLKFNAGHWPGEDRQGVIDNYVDPAAWLASVGVEHMGPPAPVPGAHDVDFGIHASADARNLAGDVDMARTGRFDLVKFLSSHDPAHVRELAILSTNATFVIRTFLSMEGRNISPGQFYNDTISDTRRTIENLRAVGVKDSQIWLEIGPNEANLVTEGLGTSWANATGFANWLSDLMPLYFNAFANDPDIRFVFPGLSPGEAVAGLRQHYHEYLAACDDLIQDFDAIGTHTYWSPAYDMLSHPHAGIGPVDYLIRMFPAMPVMVTECSHNGGGVAPDVKATSVLQFWAEMKKRPNVKGMAYYVLSATNPAWQHASPGSGEVLTPTMAEVFNRRS